jgi:glycerol-3-phosphate dehydrogenase (NAD(P)+)
MPSLVFTVLGAGSWGTALAILLGRNGHRVRLCDKDSSLLQTLAAERENKRYLPGFRLPDGVEPETDLVTAVASGDACVLAVPSGAFRDALRQLAPRLGPECGIIWATKGLELPDGKPLHEVADEELDASHPRALISGPSFAREVAQARPTAVTMASSDAAFARQAAAWFHSETFRVYTSPDVIGVELGGALKNVLAIAAGISDGLDFGANARAALITRGLHELTQLGERAGARRETLFGLSGLGDLVLTCTDDQSRNRRLGFALARGMSLNEAMGSIGQAVEGAATARVVRRLAQTYGVEMPICEQVFRVLYENLSPRQSVTELLDRALKAEHPQ